MKLRESDSDSKSFSNLSIPYPVSLSSKRDSKKVLFDKYTSTISLFSEKVVNEVYFGESIEFPRVILVYEE